MRINTVLSEHERRHALYLMQWYGPAKIAGILRRARARRGVAQIDMAGSRV
jgi:hypothetical protein